jgi:NodT family efflux transporter outer membrane factor (OMF) lipoprotein
MKVIRHTSLFLILALSGCSLAPPQKRPVIPQSHTYKESVPWVLAKPTLPEAIKNQIWWRVFKDETLNTLEAQLTQNNPSLKLAYARFQEAKALMEEAVSQMYPTLLANTGESRQKNSQTIANSFNQRTFTFNTITLQGYLTYEVDAWGAVRNTVEASLHHAAASQYDLAAVDLSLHATLAMTYFQLRGADAMQVVLDRMVDCYHHAWMLMHHLHRGGAVSALEDDQALANLEHAKTKATDMRLQRAKLRHALAVLVGEIPATFKLPKRRPPLRFVALSPGAPSTLLEQRPDISAALQRVQAANASIGVARAAFLPNFNLSSLVGVQSLDYKTLFSRPSLIWALGPPSQMTLSPPEISQIVFDGYYLQANLRHAKASYYEAVNQYQQVVLTSFQEVEDGLVETYRLDQEKIAQAEATMKAKRALYHANQRMKEGMVTYLKVVDIEVQALEQELSLIQIQTARQVASVYLIKALGGGWKRPPVPTNPDPIPRIKGAMAIPFEDERAPVQLFE